ncbi:uncharacterized protein LOC110887353 [Helianthus annuus]|uniref:uncharacterized protein LOC110887353 n=1 Tax=Helianthus annuus TaxID=4232 RepID=UPI000B8F59B4|nr:uncharacterized protein LOC110887353 [Helianthus annuus]
MAENDVTRKREKMVWKIKRVKKPARVGITLVILNVDTSCRVRDRFCNSLIQQRHHLVVRELGGEIDLEIGPGDDDPTFAHTPLITVPPQESSADDHDENKNMAAVSQLPNDDQELLKSIPVKRKKKVVKRWREEWADTYKWAYMDMKEGTFYCSITRNNYYT